MKSPSVQHTESAPNEQGFSDLTYTYELPELPTFDLSIDIDFEAYTTDSGVICLSTPPPITSPKQKMQLSGWSRCCTSSIGRRRSLISTCTSVSDVTSIETTDTDFYGRKQLSCSHVIDYVSDDVVVVITDALTLTAGMVKKKGFTWPLLISIILLMWA